MATVIQLSKKGKGLYNTTEYKASYYKNGSKDFETTVLGADLRYIKKSHTKDFETATVIKDWLKPKKKGTLKKKPAAKRKTTKRKTSKK